MQIVKDVKNKNKKKIRREGKKGTERHQCKPGARAALFEKAAFEWTLRLSMWIKCKTGTQIHGGNFVHLNQPTNYSTSYSCQAYKNTSLCSLKFHHKDTHDKILIYLSNTKMKLYFHCEKFPKFPWKKHLFPCFRSLLVLAPRQIRNTKES